MIRASIRKKIMGVAVTLIILMVVTAILSMAFVVHVGNRLDNIANGFIPAYGHLARTNIRSLERALALRRMVIERITSPSSDAALADIRLMFEAKGAEMEREAQAARDLINGLIEKGGTIVEAPALARIEGRIGAAIDILRRHLNVEIAQLIAQLDIGGVKAMDASLDRVDVLRDELNQEIDSIRSSMLALLNKSTETTVRKQREAIVIAAILTVLAASLGLLFATLISTGMTRPVRNLLEGTRAIERGDLDTTLAVTSKDEIGHLTIAFNRMIEQLRQKERIRETFGKYVDPRIVEGLVDNPTLAVEGQRRVMTVLFCDVKGYSNASEGMTAQGLVKVMNRYFSTMSEPIRDHGGIIDKFIGDAIMAYWGPPFCDDAEQTRLAALAALDMMDRIDAVRTDIPELLGLRNAPIAFDIRLGVATGEVLVGSIGSELMMSYTVIGETVNLASRLEGANKIYGSRVLVSEKTAAGAASVVETREIDRVVMLGQTNPQTIFEIMGRKGAMTDAQLELRSCFAEALSAYRASRWDHARVAFTAALQAVPGDPPSMTFLQRIERFAVTPPGQNWDGTWHLDQK
jgi:adenylate cyclase